MKILRREHRRRIGGDLDYTLGILQNIRSVAFKAYNTCGFTLDIDMAINCVVSAKNNLRKTKFRKERQ